MNKTLAALLIIFGLMNSADAAELNQLAFLSCSAYGFGFTVGIGNDTPTDVVVQVRNLVGYSERKMKVASLVTTTKEYGYSYLMLSDVAGQKDIFLRFSEDMPGTFARLEGQFFSVPSGFDPKAGSVPATAISGHVTCTIQWNKD